MNHQMKLYKIPFDRIKSGKKIIEIRLFDEKRQSLNLGDLIVFSKLPELNEHLNVEIIGLLRYKNFQDMVNDFPINNFGYPNNYDKINLIESLYKIYSKQDEQKYGVLGIRIKL